MRIAGALLLALAACTDKDKDGDPIPVDTDTGPDILNLSIPFVAELAGQPVSCNRDVQYQGASGNATVRLRGFKLYVVNVGLVQPDGNTVLLDLEQNDWQHERLALLDYEDASENCEGGTPETNNLVTGTVPAGNYAGLAFTIGVPEELNHNDIGAGTPTPLARPEMFTGALYGYHYFKLDMTTLGEPAGYPVHVHASGCLVDEFGNPAGCTGANTVVYEVPSYDPDTQQVTLDLSELLSRNNLDQNATTPAPASLPTAPGCQSDTTDPDCQNFFTSYGLSALPPAWVRADTVVTP